MFGSAPTLSAVKEGQGQACNKSASFQKRHSLQQAELTLIHNLKHTLTGVCKQLEFLLTFHLSFPGSNYPA